MKHTILITFLFSLIVFIVVLTSRKYESFRQNSCEVPVLPLDKFDVYLINMDRNKDRLQHFIRQWMRTDMKKKQFNRVTGVDGKKINIGSYVSKRAYKEIKDIESNGYRTKHYQLTPGGVGCYLSHLKTYKMISESENDYGLIFEDDVNIPKDFYVKFNNILRYVPNDWDILLLSCHCIRCKRQEVFSNVNKFIWLHCYLVRKESAKKLVDYLGKRYIEQQIDSELSDIATNQNWLNIYCINTSLSTQGGQFSTEIQKPVKYNKSVDPYSSVQV